jgi:hypothetical protein
MTLFAVTAWIVFCVRDYCLLEAGSAAEFRRRTHIYTRVTAIFVALICPLLAVAGADAVRRLVLAPAVLAIAVGLHVLTVAACRWLGKPGNRAPAWMLTLIPSPAPWILLAASTAPSFIFASTLVWMAVVSVAAQRSVREGLASDELDFPLSFARWSNCLAFSLVPLILQ